MKRLLIALLLLLAACSMAFPQQRRARNRGRRAAAERQAAPRDMQGITVRGNTVRFTREWVIVKGNDGVTYAKKKKKTKVYVAAVSCLCSLSGGSCFLQGRGDSGLDCVGATTCAGGSCTVKLDWVEPKKIEEVGLPGGN